MCVCTFVCVCFYVDQISKNKFIYLVFTIGIYQSFFLFYYFFYFYDEMCQKISMGMNERNEMPYNIEKYTVITYFFK